MDIDSIHAGLNFSTVIAEQVSMVDAVIVMIGPTWAARLHNQGDLVRMEVVESIEAECAVVPVLIEDTPMPATESLPPDLQALLALNITRVRGGVDFHRDTTRALEGLEAGVAIARRAKAAKVEAELRRLAAEAELARKAVRDSLKAKAVAPANPRRWAVLGTIAALLAATATYAAWPGDAENAKSATTTSIGLTTSSAETTASESSTTAPTVLTDAELILAVLQANYNDFYQLVMQDSTARELLGDSTQVATVFVPSNDVLVDMADVLADPSDLAKFVEYHIMQQNHTPEEFAKGTYTTLGGYPISVTKAATGYTINDQVSIVGDGIGARNGRIVEIAAPLWNPILGDPPSSLVPTPTTAPRPTESTTTTIAATSYTFTFTKIYPASTSIQAGMEKVIPVTVSWINAPSGGEYLCIGRSEQNVPRDEGGYVVAYMAQSGNCSGVASTNGSATVNLLIGGNSPGVATYTVYDAEGRAVGSKTFTITVVP